MTVKKPDKTLNWWNSPRKLLRAILMLDDSAHSIALGTAIGMFIGMTPTVGVQMILVAIFGFLMRPFFRFNQIAAMVTVYISNPLTMVPIYWFNYKVGNIFVPGNVSRDAFSAIFQYNGFSEWWDAIVELFVNIGEPLILGSLIVATACSLPTYPLIRWLLSRRESNQAPADEAENSEQAQVATSASN